VFIALIQSLSRWAIPFFLTVTLITGLLKKVPVYETFVEGAKEGFDTAIKILPYLLGMYVSITMFRQSGALDWLLSVLKPLSVWLNLPQEILPLLFLRPLSGSASLAYLSDLLKKHGPDSLIGLTASTMQGSTETTLYVLTVYFGSVGVKNARYSLLVGLMADLAGFILAVLAVRLVFL
jgi:spore maturation protein B